MCQIVNRVPTVLEGWKTSRKVVIYLMRHGDPSYEADGPRPLDPQEPIQFEGKLTKEGMIQIELASRKLVKEFGDMPKSVILASSPRRRTKESLDILRRVLEECGVSISPYSSELVEAQKLMIDATLTGALLEEYGKQAERNKNLTWMEFWIRESANFQNVESAADFEKRMKNLILYFQDFSQRVDLFETIVCLIHEEEVKIIASLFGISVMEVPNGTGLKLIFNLEEAAIEIEVQGEVERLNFEQFNKKEERQ